MDAAVRYVGVEFKSATNPPSGVKTCGASESPKIHVRSNPGLDSAMAFEVADVVYVVGAGLVIAETVGAVVVLDPATAKKCKNIGS